MFITVPIGALMGPPMWIRFYSAEKTESFGIIPLLICLTAIQCIGTLFAGSAGIIMAPGIKQTDSIIPVMLWEHGDLILSALLFCGVASAALSTANSQIHAVAAVYTIDIHKRYINKTASEKKLVAIGKWAVLMISASAYVLLLNNPVMIIYTGTIGMSGTAQIFVPAVGALFWNRSNGKAAACGVAAGIFVLTAIALLTDMNISYCAVIALVVNATVFIVCSLKLRPDAKTRERIVNYRDLYEKEV